MLMGPTMIIDINRVNETRQQYIVLICFDTVLGTFSGGQGVGGA